MNTEEIISSSILARLSELAGCRSTSELHSHPTYQELQLDIEGLLARVEVGDFRSAAAAGKDSYRVVAWNVERGAMLDSQIETLQRHHYLRGFDVLLLTEVDLGMARSGNRHVARDLARELGLTYAFVPCYLNLSKGSGVEHDVDGENELGLQGNAILSRYPMTEVRRIPLANGTDKMSRREKRLGCLNALSAHVHFPETPITAAAVHLDAHSTQQHRHDQLRDVLSVLDPSRTCLVGGDWNTSTYNSSTAFHAIMGYWLRLFMGVNNVIRNHYMHPYRWFEKQLFEMIESLGFDYRSCNVVGEPTAVYDMVGTKDHRNLGEWIPGWCFPFIRWALRKQGGICPLKLDWFAARRLHTHGPVVVHGLASSQGIPLSDHDPICIDVAPLP